MGRVAPFSCLETVLARALSVAERGRGVILA